MNRHDADSPIDHKTAASPSRPLEDWELTMLATYNSERARGLIHDDDWRAKMARLQERFHAVGFLTPQKQWWRRGR